MAVRCRKSISLVVVLFAAAFAFTGTLAGARVSHAHNAVLEYRDTHPGASVPVIVQSDEEHDPFEIVRANQGSVRNVLGIIHAVAAEVPSDRIDALATAHGVTWVSLDAGIASADKGSDDGTSDDGKTKNKPIGEGGPAAPQSVFPQEIHADKVWKDGGLGQGVGVAVVDTGITSSKDFNGTRGTRIVAQVSRDGSTGDGYGHGSHVAGLIGGNGLNSGLRYLGVAPLVNLVDVKVGADDGSASVSDVITGLQFVLDNQSQYNIRVVNLSLRSDTAQSYLTDPLDAAVELLAFRGILVVVAAGNTGTVADAVSYAPGNDPFVLSVGAVDDIGTPDFKDDTVPAWSSRGTTQDGFAKPEVSVPGRHLISVLSPNSALAQEFPQNVVGTSYFMLSGTSMAAGVASGAAALVFQAHPDWTPGQVKQALAQTASTLPADASARIAQLDKATKLKTPVDPTQDVKPNYLLLSAAGVTDPQSISWDKISWSKISWGSISWSKISWGSVSWSKISWGDVEE